MARGVTLATALIVGTLGLTSDAAAAPSNPPSISNVTVKLAAPEQSAGAFQATATVKNTGNIPQPAGTKVTWQVDGGTIDDLPAGCTSATARRKAPRKRPAGKTKPPTNECTAGRLDAGESTTFTVTVVPANGVTSVVTKVDVVAAREEFNVRDEDGDTDSKTTQIGQPLTLDLTNTPKQVRFGDDTLLRALVTNGDPAQNITVVVNTGNVHDTAQTLPAGCSPAGGATITCTASFAAGEAKTFDIAVASPTSGASFTSSATATGAVIGSANDSVTTALSEESSAYVPEGEQLTSDDETSKTIFRVPAGSTESGGLPVVLNEVDVDTACGDQPCKERAAEALFPDEGNDPAHPFVWDITYEVPRECNADGTFCLVRDIYYIPSGSDTAIQMPKCSTFSRTAPVTPVLASVDEVCLNFVSWTETTTTYQVVLLRDIVIPILSGIRR